MHSLLLALGYPVQSRVLRCAGQAGLTVSVLGNTEAKWLKYSRFCKTFDPIPAHLEHAPEQHLEDWVQLIVNVARKRGVDILLPGDAQTTLLLGRLKSRFEGEFGIRVFPVPSENAFHQLNDKWAFYQNCLRLGLPVPQTWLFASKAEALDALASEKFPKKLVIKPVEGWGGFGVKIVDFDKARAEIEGLDYAPLLVQEYIEGEDTGLSVLTVQGEVVASLIHQVRKRQFFFFKNEEYLRIGEQIALDLDCDGILHIDAQMTPNGELYLLECNPRVYLSMDYAIVAGINLIELGLSKRQESMPVVTVPDTTIRKPVALLQALTRFRKTERADWRMTAFLMSDPGMFLFDNLRMLFREETV